MGISRMAGNRNKRFGRQSIIHAGGSLRLEYIVVGLACDHKGVKIVQHNLLPKLVKLSRTDPSARLIKRMS